MGYSFQTFSACALSKFLPELRVHSFWSVLIEVYSHHPVRFLHLFNNFWLTLIVSIEVVSFWVGINDVIIVISWL